MKIIVKQRVSRVLAAVLMLGAAGCGYFTDDSGKTVIRVNDRNVTAGEYREALKRLLPADLKQPGEEVAQLKKELVNEIVEEELLLEEAERLGIKVEKEETASEVDLIKKEYGEESFRKAIGERYGSLEKWEDRIKRKLLSRKVIDSISSGVQVPDREAQAFYRANLSEFKRPDQVHARMIVVSSEEEAGKIRARLTPQNFAEVAKEVSLSPEGKNGGDLGSFGRGDMPGEFESVVFPLKPGEISKVVKTEYGFHIFYLEGKRKGGTLSFAEAKGKIMERLRNEKSAALLNDWIEARKRSSKIEVREELL